MKYDLIFWGAIAGNLGLALFNLFLIRKIKAWHRQLRQFRQQCTEEERRASLDTERYLASLDAASEGMKTLGDRHQEIRRTLNHVQLIVHLSERIPFHLFRRST